MITNGQIQHFDALIDQLHSAPRIEGTNYLLHGAVPMPVRANNLLVAVVAPSGTGKTTLIEGYSVVKTATSRSRQERDKPDAYIWMDPETPEAVRKGLLGLEEIGDRRYRTYLEDRYRLVESNLFGGNNLYGTPRASIVSALQSSDTGVAFATSEPHGAEQLRLNIEPELASVVVLGVIPSSAAFVVKNLESRNNAGDRFATGNIELAWMLNNCNILVDNREGMLPFVRADLATYFFPALSATCPREQSVAA